MRSVRTLTMPIRQIISLPLIALMTNVLLTVRNHVSFINDEQRKKAKTSCIAGFTVNFSREINLCLAWSLAKDGGNKTASVVVHPISPALMEEG